MNLKGDKRVHYNRRKFAIDKNTRLFICIWHSYTF